MVTIASPSPELDDDPWATAESAKPQAFTAFGQLSVDVWYGVLQKGAPQGKAVFDPLQHSIDQRVTCIDLIISPVIPGRTEIRRSLIAESPDWSRIMLPSLKTAAPSLSLKQLNNGFVQAEVVDGTRKRDDGTYWTTLRFVKFFGHDQAAEQMCFTAAQTFRRRGDVQDAAEVPEPTQSATPASAITTTATVVVTAPPAPVPGANRETARAFLPFLVRQAAGDLTKLEALLKSNPLTAATYTVTDPEIAVLWAQAQR